MSLTRRRPRPITQGLRPLSPLLDFLRTEASSGVVLVAGAVAALVWANSPWSASYHDLWNTVVSVSAGDHTLRLTLRDWINHGLLTVFFFVVGLEIKRELVSGQLADRRAALLPVVAAIGGMAAPALLYLAIAGGTAPRGWAVVVATDIPLALGVLALAGARVPSTMRVFLLALAIVDDVGALIIIAVFYSSGIELAWLAVACVVFAVAVLARRIGVQLAWVYVVLRCATWLALHNAGVSATLTGVAMGLLAPSTPRIAPEFIDVEQLADVSSVEAARVSTEIARNSVSVVEWLEHVLHPWVSYGVVPLFALANTGITLTSDRIDAALRSPITWAIVVGRVIGKPVGIIAATRGLVAIASAPPDRTGRRQFVGVAASAGMGFTVALFVIELALDDEAKRWNATFGVIVAAVVAGATSLAILRGRSRRPS